MTGDDVTARLDEIQRLRAAATQQRLDAVARGELPPPVRITGDHRELSRLAACALNEWEQFEGGDAVAAVTDDGELSWDEVDRSEWLGIMLADALTPVPELVAAVRAVLDLADELDRGGIGRFTPGYAADLLRLRLDTALARPPRPAARPGQHRSHDVNGEERVWRHFRWLEPHEAVPIPGTEYDDPSGKIGARCANCDNGEAIGAPAPGGRTRDAREQIVRVINDRRWQYGWTSRELADAVLACPTIAEVFAAVAEAERLKAENVDLRRKCLAALPSDD